MRRTEYIMWTIIFLLIIASMVSGLIYLVSRVYKTDFIEKTSKGKKSLRILISILLVIAVFAAVWFAMGKMNAIVCLIHLVVFWILFHETWAFCTTLKSLAAFDDFNSIFAKHDKNAVKII